MMETSPKYCNIKAITCLNDEFQLFSAKQAQTIYTIKNLKYVQSCTSLSLKFNTC